MFEYRYGIKLKKVTADAAALRILRKYFPNQSLSELRTKVQAHDYVLHSHMEEYNSDFQVAKLMQEFDKAGIETELFEEYRYAPAPWQIEPMNRKYLKNMPQRYCEIRRQVLEDIERETVGYINPGAKTIIDKGMGSSSNNKVHLDIDGMGIVFYSAETMKDVIPNTDFLSSEFTSPQQIANHIKKGDITAFCTGSSGSFDIHFFEGYPSVDILEKFPVSIRLALDVQGGSIQFCDLFWLSKWNTDFPKNQMIELPDGYYEMTVCTCLPESGCWGDEQTIYIYFNKVDKMPELTWTGVPYLFTEE